MKSFWKLDNALRPLIYFDNSATTKPYPEAINKASWIMAECYGNPSSAHFLGEQSHIVMECARRQVADLIGCQSHEIYFTSGGTESDNLAIFGACSLMALQGKKKIVTTTVEHAAVTKTVRILKRFGWQVEYIPAPGGVLDIEAMKKAIDEKTALISAMLVNNEIGCIFPISEISEIIRRKKLPVILHTDAVQALGKIYFSPQSLGADLISVSAHKIHGIKGIGALFVKNGLKLHAHHFGGGQERGLRPGTESIPLIAAFGIASQIVLERMEKDVLHIKKLQNYCHASLQKAIPNVKIHSTETGAPHIVSFSIPGEESSKIVTYLSQRGICISNGAACKTHFKNKGPQILESFGFHSESIYSALRVSFCADNTEKEIDALIDVLSKRKLKN
jgi:cysteine desulfurase